jgi:glucokinase
MREFNIKTDAFKGRRIVLEKISSQIKQLLDKDTRAIGIGIPGQVDLKNGRVLNLINIPGFKDIALKKDLENEFRLPVALQNDAKCFAIGERKFGAHGKKYENFVGMTIGTGIGCGIIIDGKIYSGKDNFAGEFGHTILKVDGPDCNCGKKGCFEQFASGSGIEKRAIEMLRAANLKTALKEDEITTKKIFQEALKGDEFAKKVVEESAYFLGLGISNIITALNPEAIILGGSVSKSFGQMEKITLETIRENTFQPAGQTPVLVSTLENPALFGAAALAMELM